MPGAAPIILLIGPSSVGKSTICETIIQNAEERNELNYYYGDGRERKYDITTWGHDAEKAVSPVIGREWVGNMYKRVFENSRNGKITLLDLGSTDRTIIAGFNRHLAEAKSSDPDFDPPVLKFAVHLPLEVLSARLHERNEKARSEGRLSFDGRYGAPVISGYVGLVCHLDRDAVDPARFTGERLTRENAYNFFNPLKQEGVLERGIENFMQSLGFTEQRHEIEVGLRDPGFDGFFINDSRDKPQMIATSILNAIDEIMKSLEAVPSTVLEEKSGESLKDSAAKDSPKKGNDGKGF